MTENEKLAWAAGFFDGEGSIVISETSQGRFAGHVILAQKRIEPLKYVQKIAAAHDIMCPNPRQVYWANGGKGYTLAFNSQKGRAFLELLLPYLQEPEKKTRALFYIRFFIPGGGYPLGAEKKKLWPEWLKIRATARR